MDSSLRHVAQVKDNRDGIWMLVGQDGKLAQAPFTITDDIMNLNAQTANVAQIVLPHNKGFASHVHWLKRFNKIPLVYPAYVFFQEPLKQLEPDRRLVDMSKSKTYPNGYGLYLA